MELTFPHGGMNLKQGWTGRGIPPMRDWRDLIVTLAAVWGERRDLLKIWFKAELAGGNERIYLKMARGWWDQREGMRDWRDPIATLASVWGKWRISIESWLEGERQWNSLAIIFDYFKNKICHLVHLICYGFAYQWYTSVQISAKNCTGFQQFSLLPIKIIPFDFSYFLIR